MYWTVSRRIQKPKTMEPVKKASPPGVLNMEIFQGGMNVIISILTQDISAAWKNVAEWQKDQSSRPEIGKAAYKIHSFTVTAISLNNQLMPQAVPAMMVVVIMEKVIFTPLLPKSE